VAHSLPLFDPALDDAEVASRPASISASVQLVTVPEPGGLLLFLVGLAALLYFVTKRRKR
jgi:hypothetical protein